MPETGIHPSRFELTRQLMGELEENEHTRSCLVCKRVLDELAAIQEQGTRAAPPWAEVLEKDRRPRRRRFLAPALALAASIAALAILIPRNTGVRAKGEVEVALFCQTPSAARPAPCRSGDTVPAKTALAFRIKLDARRHLMLLGHDSGGKWATYFPKSGENSLSVAPEVEDFMNGSLVLDEIPGDEIFALFSSSSEFSRADLVQAIGKNGAIELEKLPPAIQVEKFVLTKTRREALER